MYYYYNIPHKHRSTRMCLFLSIQALASYTFKSHPSNRHVYYIMTQDALPPCRVAEDKTLIFMLCVHLYILLHAVRNPMIDMF